MLCCDLKKKALYLLNVQGRTVPDSAPCPRLMSALFCSVLVPSACTQFSVDLQQVVVNLCAVLEVPFVLKTNLS